ncbi:hypothetical protein [Pseudooceanicola algae]|uniref:Terminase-like family protein n=1 Tax=Pseudooceanicola algae TaxID=1537215 RepID=A0A418SK71_9RHOB|nr:hypothetical protein [Pseudooceanicola algae]QPM89145.1 hypothetical protein PSAL_003560 [Pseudooceanicola algae]
MNAKSGNGQRGRGEASDLATAGGRGFTAEQIEALQGSDAKEAIASLEGDFASGNMPDLDVVQFPGPIAERFFWSNDDVIAIQGPVGSGKTTTLMKSRARRAVEMPRSTIDGVRRYKVLFIRETYRQLWSTTIPSYLETFPKDLGTWSGGRGDPVTHVIRFADAYGPIEFTAEFMAFGDDIVASMRGVQTTDIVLNELDTMPVEILTVGIGRIDRYPARNHFEGLPDHLRSYGQIVGDMNAPDEDNWGFRVFHDADERRRMAELLSAELPEGANRITIEFCNQPGYGEPGCENLQNLSSSYYPRQIAAMQLAGRGDMVDRLVRNRIVYLRAGDPVFRREFSPRIHVSDTPLKPIPGLPLRIGLDQGFKGAAVIAQMTGFFRWRILGEMHFPDERLMAAVFGQRLADLLEQRWPGAHVEAGWGDMAGEHGASQAATENATWNMLVGKASGITIRPQRLGTNRIQPRLEAVRAALEAPLDAGEPGLLLDPSCKFLRRGFEARYVWTERVDASGDKRKVPDKSLTEANVMDGLQYLLLSEHAGDGSPPYAKRRPDRHEARQGAIRGPRRAGVRDGLNPGWDILDPYAEGAGR